MGKPEAILKRLRGQTRMLPDWYKEEVLLESETHKDVGQVKALEDYTSPTRVQFYREGYQDVFDSNLFKLRRAGLTRTQVHANDPNTFRVIYTHEVIDKKTSKVVGEVLTRLFRAPGAGPSWDLLSIKLHEIELYRLKGA